MLRVAVVSVVLLAVLSLEQHVPEGDEGWCWDDMNHVWRKKGGKWSLCFSVSMCFSGREISGFQILDLHFRSLRYTKRTDRRNSLNKTSKTNIKMSLR